MNLRRLTLGFSVLVAISISIAWLSGWFEDKIAPGQLQQPGPLVDAGADTAVVKRVTEPAVEWASGAVESATRTTVASRILARIESVLVAAGNEVAQGDLLATLDSRDLKSRVQQARDAVRAAEAQRDLARTEAERATELLKRGVATRQRSDQAQSDLRVADAEVSRLNQNLKEAETTLTYTEIRAPVAGRVIDRLAEPGDTVSPGQPLLRLYDPKSLRLAAPVRESLAVNLKVGDMLQVEISSLGETISGPIKEIVPFSEPGARTLLVRVGLPFDARHFAGMFARVAVPAGERVRLLVPAESVIRIGQLEFVTVVRNGRATRQLVTSGGRTSDGQLEILGGLREGDLVMM